MKRWATTVTVTVLVSVWFSSCLDFGAELEGCRHAGRCAASMGAGGESVSTDGGGSASADGGGSVSTDGGGSASADGGGSVSTDGGGNASSDGGGNARADGGGSVSTDGGGSISTDGGGSISTDGGGSASTDGGGNASTDGGGSVSTEQVALQTETRHTEAGTSSTASTFSSSSFSLYVRNDSTFTQVPSGGPSGPGRYVFTDVPVGQRYLRRGNTWLVDPPSTVDFSYRTYGRTDTGFADGGVRLEVSSSGMNSWVDGSELELVSPDVGLVGFNFEKGLVSQLTTGLPPSSLAFDYVSAYASYWGTDSPVPLIDTRKGDVVYLTQLEASSLSVGRGEVLRLLALVKSAQLSPITLASGTTKVTGVFSAPTQSTSVAIDWRRSAYWAQGPEVTPNYVFDSARESFRIVAIPYFGDEGLYESAANLLAVGEYTKGQSSDLLLIRTIRNPYPPSWSLAALRRYCHFGPVQTAGGTATIQRGGCSVEWDPLDAVNGQPLTPKLSPPRDLRVDGQPAYGALTLTRTSPTVTWTAPTVGSVDSYVLAVWHVYDSGNGLDWEWVAEVLTRGTSLVIPPGVLDPEEYYYFVISAQNGVDIATPFKTARSKKLATGLSGVLRVQ